MPLERIEKGAITLYRDMGYKEYSYDQLGIRVRTDKQRKRQFCKLNFPTYPEAVTFLVERKLGYDIKPPQFGHWIDFNSWKPLCLVREVYASGKEPVVTTYPLEVKDG